MNILNELSIIFGWEFFLNWWLLIVTGVPVTVVLIVYAAKIWWHYLTFSDYRVGGDE